MRSAISDEYVVYLQESDFDLEIDEDPISFSQAMESVNSDRWLDAMKEEFKSMEIQRSACQWRHQEP